MSNASVFRMDHLKITGNEIIALMGIAPGPEVGDIKKQLFEAVLDNPKLNQLDTLKSLCRSLQIKK
jgi:tRNA nucleotidyltransferase (CCA-adding enzyme)